MGDTDTAMLWTIVTIFVLLGAILPFVNADFNQEVTNVDNKGVEFATGQTLQPDDTSVSVLGVIGSIFLMFFFTFGAIPVFVDLIILTPMRIMFLVILYRNVRGN